MMSIENYKKTLESMSKEELINEISNLISDHGIQLQNKNVELQELKSALARADLQLQFQIGEVDLNNREIERLTKELANERNAVITFQESANAHRLKVGEVMKQNAELQEQVDELKSALADTVKRNEELIEENEQSVKGTANWVLEEIVKLRKEEHGIYYSAYDYAIEIGKRVRRKYGVEAE